MVDVIGVGQIVIWQGGSLWIGESRGPTRRHAHHAIQLSIALSGELRFTIEGLPGWHEFRAALVPPHVEHAFDAAGSLVANLFCEPESLVGRRLLARFGADRITPLPADEIEALSRHMYRCYLETADEAALQGTATSALQMLTEQAPAAGAPDPRITKAIDAIWRLLSQPMTLNQIAAAVHLSPSRFRHLFVTETGLPFRRYVLWQRLQRALQLAGAGTSWSQAAHESGFADAAHLVRTFRRMFGIAPTSVVRSALLPGKPAMADRPGGAGEKPLR